MASLILTPDYTSLGTGVNLDNATEPLDILLPDSYRSGHILVSGSTRSGKSRLCENIIEQDIRKGYNIILIDPKIDQDLANKVTQIAIACGRGNDLMFINVLFPEYSISINPLSHWFLQEEIVAHCVAGIEDGKEAFYRNIGKLICTIVIDALNLLSHLAGAGRAKFSFEDIASRVSRQGLLDLSSELSSHAENYPAADKLNNRVLSLLNSGEEYYGKVSTSLQITLQDLTTGNVGRIVGTGTANKFLDKLEQGKGVILVGQMGNMVVDDAAKTLAKVILSMVLKYAGRVIGSDREKFAIPLCLHIDECQSILFASFNDAYAKIGSSNTWITSYVQDFAQIKAEMGPDHAQAIMANNNTKIFLRSPDPDSAELITKHFGTHKVLSPIMAFNTITTREVEEDVIAPFDVIALRPREFYMMTYSGGTGYRGRYRGTTYDVSPMWVKINYPNAPATAYGATTASTTPGGVP